MLAAIASGRLVLGVLTVIVFSVGFASVLVLIGLVAARLGEAVLAWLSSRRMAWFQFGTALVIACVGAGLTVGAWRAIGPWP
jgi:nickel/cobalt exporter